VQRAGGDCRVEPLAGQRLVARQIPVDVDGLRRPSLADHRGDLALAHRIHQHQCFAAEAVEVLFDDAADEE
jgi:hypothetical protein